MPRIARLLQCLGRSASCTVALVAPPSSLGRIRRLSSSLVALAPPSSLGRIRQLSSSPFHFASEDIPPGFDRSTLLFLVMSTYISLHIWGDRLHPKELYNRFKTFRSASPAEDDSSSSALDHSSSPPAEDQSSQPNLPVHNAAQRFTVEFVLEGSEMKTVEVLCEIGLEGIKMRDPSTSEPLSFIYFGNITKLRVKNRSVFTIWVKGLLDKSPKQITLHSSTDEGDLLVAIVAASKISLLKECLEESLLRNRS